MGEERSFAGRVKATAVAVEGIPMVLLCLQCVLLQQGGFPGLWLLALCCEGAQCEDITTVTHSPHIPAFLEQTVWPWEGWGQHLLLRRDPSVVNPRTLSTHHPNLGTLPPNPYPAPGTPNPAPHNLHPAFDTPHSAPCTQHSIPSAWHPKSYSLQPASCT